MIDGIPVIESTMIHTSDHPFCGDLTCPCHHDEELLADVGDALASGRLRDEDACRVIYGEMDLPEAA
jgi:hypothetical protein